MTMTMTDIQAIVQNVTATPCVIHVTGAAVRDSWSIWIALTPGARIAQAK